MIEETTTLAPGEVSVDRLRAPLASPNASYWDNDPTDPVHVVVIDDVADDWLY